jgi:hypothetical protein
VHVATGKRVVVRRRSDAAAAGLANLPLEEGAEFQPAAGFDEVAADD